MTRGAIKQYIRSFVGEQASGPGSANPASLDGMINTVTDQEAQSTQCYYTNTTTEIYSGQSRYSNPAMYRIDAVFYFDTYGNKVQLGFSVPTDLDNYDGGAWRNDAQGLPLWYATEGMSTAVLYPTPNFNSITATYTDLVIGSNTLTVTSTARPFTSADVNKFLSINGGTGFTVGKPQILSVASNVATLSASAGTAASTGGTASLTTGGLYFEGLGVPRNTWAGDTTECPLPGGDEAHWTIIWRCCKLRAMESRKPELIALIPAWESEYRRAHGLLESASALFTSARRYRDVSLGSGAQNLNFNPLNL